MSGGGAGLSLFGAFTHPDEIERRLADALGSLCLVTASQRDQVHYRRLQARLASVAPGKLLVAFFGPVEQPEMPFAVDLEIIHEGAGFLRMRTMALEITSETLQAPLPGKIEVDRRRWPRVAVRLPAQMTLCDAEWRAQESHGVRVQDLSPIGAAFVSERPLEIGDRLILKLGEPAPPVRAQVVRVTRAAGLMVFGVVLISPDPALRQYVLNLLGQSQ